MRRQLRFRILSSVIGGGFILSPTMLAAQDTPAVEPTVAVEAAPVASPAEPATAPALNYLADSASPFGKPEYTEAEKAKVEMPKLDFVASEKDTESFDKYYYFYRPDTDFDTAYSDIRECDGYASGLQSGIGYTQTPYPYAGTLGGAVGGVIGNAMAAAIFGSAETRKLRRVNMRRCMHYKGYERYGLEKDLWQKFNFEEGLGSVNERDRKQYLMQQALVASSANPQGKGLGL